MTATTSVRVAAKARLAELIRQHAPSGVQVEHGIPRDPPAESIMVQSVTGQHSTPYMMAGRKRRKDTFTITVGVWAGQPGQASAAAAEDRCAELIAAVENAVAEHATLDGLVQSCTLGTIDGPDSSGTDEGWVGHALVDVSVTAELT